jgi:hypothetical protein
MIPTSVIPQWLHLEVAAAFGAKSVVSGDIEAAVQDCGAFVERTMRLAHTQTTFTVCDLEASQVAALSAYLAAVEGLSIAVGSVNALRNAMDAAAAEIRGGEGLFIRADIRVEWCTDDTLGTLGSMDAQSHSTYALDQSCSPSSMDSTKPHMPTYIPRTCGSGRRCKSNIGPVSRFQTHGSICTPTGPPRPLAPTSSLLHKNLPPPSTTMHFSRELLRIEATATAEDWTAVTRGIVRAVEAHDGAGGGFLERSTKLSADFQTTFQIVDVPATFIGKH